MSGISIRRIVTEFRTVAAWGSVGGMEHIGEASSGIDFIIRNWLLVICLVTPTILILASIIVPKPKD
jgi:hypothetical protein